MEVEMFQGRKIKVTKISNGRRCHLLRIILLMFCICLFSSDAMALYSIFETGDSDVYGLYSADNLVLPGAEFGSVIVIASQGDAYSIYSSDANITIDGLFDSTAVITATAAGTDNAFCLFTPNGSIYTGRLNGVINAQSEESWAVGLYSPIGDVNTGDIGGTISSQAGTYWAVGLYGHSINTGNINGTINAVASDSEAVGIYSDGVASIHIGNINGTIYAEATYGTEAAGIYSDSDVTIGNIGVDANIVAIAELGGAWGIGSGGGENTLEIGNIDGKITADVNNGSEVYALYASDSDLIVGNIGSTALIGARGTTSEIPGSAYGMYSGNSIIIGDINGTIYAEMTDGPDAYAIYAVNDVTIGNIGSDANIWAKADGGFAAGISSGGIIDTLRTGDIAGRITADVNDGLAAFAMFSTSDIVVDGDITNTAVIGATARGGLELLSAYGMYSNNSITIGDINGTIYAEKPDGMGAYAIYAANDVTIGNIGSDANIWAAAEYGDAYGIYSGGGITTLTTGDIAGRITADVNDGSDAYAMYSGTDIVVDGNITSTAVIGATAKGSIEVSAYGMYSDNSITIGDVNGTIYAEKPDGSGAYAIYAANDVTIGNIGSDANIWAAAEYSDAYGIYSGSLITTITTGDIDGRITADVNNGSGAFAMYSDSNIVVDGDIGSTALISATASEDLAVGLYSGGGSIHTGDVNGVISAQALDGSDAYALYSVGATSIHTGDINGEITAFAEVDDAYGLFSGGFVCAIDTGDINGTITADANTGSYAYAMYTDSNITTGNIASGALISASAGQDWAAGLFSSSNSIYTGDVNGVITADANNLAFGMYSGAGESIHTGGINGTISADANDFYAYAMWSYDDIEIGGDIGSDANISATAGDSFAGALYSSNGSIDTNDIDGRISAQAINGSNAYGLYSGAGDSIHIGDVNGTITADANDSFAYAISSYEDIEVGNIESEANISASAGQIFAYGLYSNGGSIYTGDIDGVIAADANNYAYGMSSGSIATIETGDINGTITADANDSYAFAMFSSGDIVIDGNITSDARISATAGQSYAYGLNSAGGVGSVHIGDVNGVISADANEGSFAYAISSNSGIWIGDIGSDANISATAGESYAVGLYSTFDDVNTGDIDGTISAKAGSMYASGLAAENGSVYTGDINGEIIAMAEDGYAVGLASNDITSIHTGDVNGIIIADVNNGSYAYGMLSSSDITIGNITSNGLISATAEYGYAYGLYSGGLFSIHIGDVNGVIIADVNNGSWAYGMYSDSDITVGNIGSDALISATASGDYAYGLYSDVGRSIHTGDIDGTIIATSGGDNAAGLYSATSSVTTGNINGVISATAAGIGNDTAYGIYGFGPVTIGDVNGVISAEMTNGFGAYAIRSDTDVTTGNITSNALISAMAEYGDAYGIYSGGGQTITTGDVNGVIIADVNDGSGAYGMYSTTSIVTGNIGSDANITASASGWRARGLYSGNGDIDTNDIDGKITATVGENYAYALHSVDGDINTDDIGSTAVITATAARSRAYGLYSEDGSIYTGNINGTINATAGDMYAYGLYNSGEGSINVGDVNGVITATANYQAMGIFSEGHSTINIGDVNGLISATSATETAYGLRSWGDVNVVDISGTISATSAERKAAGIFNEGMLTTTVSGTITAYSDADFVYGILSYGPMDVNVDGGTISAIANGGPYAAAIQSGRMGSLAIGLVTQDANDTVGITAGSTIIGDVDLAMFGTDDDLLTLSGLNSNSTTFADDINNVETINVTGGTFYVDANVLNSTNGITMYGGVLGGIGNIMCDLHVIDGTFAPGHSIDTIHIGGDWIMDPDGIYEAEVDNSENADLTIVDGTTYLDGTIRGKVVGERIDHSFSALVIDSNGLDGVFADVNSATLFPIFSVSYDTDNNDVYLNVLFDYAYYAQTPNQHAVGRALNRIVSGGRDTGDMNDVLDVIDHLPSGRAANEAYNQLLPQDMLGLPDVIRRVMNQHNDGIMEQLDNFRRANQYATMDNNRYLFADAANSAVMPPQSDEWMPFIKGIGMWADRDSEIDVAGYKYSVYGGIAGMDKLYSENTLFGFGIGGTRTSVDYTRGGTEADIDSLLVSLHGSYFEDDWHLDLTAGYGHSWYDQERRIAFLNRKAKSDHESNAFSFAAEYGKNLGGTGAILEPVAGVGYTIVDEESYTESSAGAAGLRVDGDTYDGFYSKLGVQAAAEMQLEDNPDVIMVPKLSAFWIHDFADRVELSSSFIGGGSFTTRGLDAVEDMLHVGAGLNVYLKDNKRLFVDYIWQYSSDFQSNLVQAGLQWPY